MENLDDRIDAIFASTAGVDTRPLILSHGELSSLMKRVRRSATLRPPKHFTASSIGPSGDVVNAHETVMAMENEVRMAFLGGASVGDLAGYPGLGIIKELKAQEKEVQERSSHVKQAREAKARRIIEREALDNKPVARAGVLSMFSKENHQTNEALDTTSDATAEDSSISSKEDTQKSQPS